MNKRPKSMNVLTCGLLLATWAFQQAVSAANISGNNVTSDLTVQGEVVAEGGGWFKDIWLTLGANKETQWRWSANGPTAGTTWMHIGRESGTFGWRDNTASSPHLKMAIDQNNILTLYKAEGGVASISFDPANGKIDLKGNSGGGLYSGSTPIIAVGSGGTASMSATNLTVVADSTFNGVGVGKGAGTGVNNSIVGAGSLAVNTSGTQNSAVGSSSLSFNTTGSHNSALGAGALSTNTTGTSNVAVGVNALSNNIAGADNVAIGTSAGTKLADNTTALTGPSNSVFIGSGSKGSSATVVNTIVIGTNAVSKGSNTTVIGNDATTETHLKGAVILAAPQGDISMGAYAN